MGSPFQTQPGCCPASLTGEEDTSAAAAKLAPSHAIRRQQANLEFPRLAFPFKSESPIVNSCCSSCSPAGEFVRSSKTGSLVLTRFFRPRASAVRISGGTCGFCTPIFDRLPYVIRYVYLTREVSVHVPFVRSAVAKTD